MPESLPLGIKQRLQLAVAVLPEPAILILDEPTSGVDPIARDAFWRSMIDLSRDEGVTIFLSTHFMNEAERCDRISLMHAGKVLAVGAPPIRSAAEADRRLRSGNTQIVVEVPGGFGRDLLRGAKPEVDGTVDGAMTFRGETARNYVAGVVRT